MEKKEAYWMKSPITGGAVYLCEGMETQTFRNEKFQVYVRYYECADTGGHFTTEDQDEQAFNELYNQYRVRHGIPFPDEIKRIRERYGLTLSQITEIVGFGQNQWRQYENGCVPSESNGKSIAAIKDRNGMLSMLSACKEQLGDKKYEKIRNKVLCAPDSANDDPLSVYFYGNTKRGIYNGFSEMNPDKLQSMVQFIVSKEKNGVSKTKLNKEMFYADFCCYKKYGRSISGLSYRAIQYGPVPEHYETVYDHVQGLTKRNVSDNSDFDYDLFFCQEPDTSHLGKEDTDIINEVMSVLAGMSRAEVVEMSHKESAWENNGERHSLIPYSEAYKLAAFPCQ
jgi:uncharacterized phage-associated protein/DNA-binding transcriptional regulator YiaG